MGIFVYYMNMGHMCSIIYVSSFVVFSQDGGEWGLGEGGGGGGFVDPFLPLYKYHYYWRLSLHSCDVFIFTYQSCMHLHDVI